MPKTSRLGEQIVNLWSEIADPESWKPALNDWPEILAPFGPRYPQPGYIGKNYSRNRIVVMGINPGKGGERNKLADDEIFHHTLQLALSPTGKHHRSLMTTYRKHMDTWDIFSRIGFPARFGLEWEDIAYMNVLQVNTKVKCYHRSATPLYEYAIDNFTSRQLALLEPKAVLMLGKHGYKMLGRFWDRKPSELRIEAIIHPSSLEARLQHNKLTSEMKRARLFLDEISSGFR